MRRTVEQMAAVECLMHAQCSREMWKGMKASGFGWTWDHYRGWLADARAFRLGTEFKGLGSKGLKKPVVRRPAFSAI